MKEPKHYLFPGIKKVMQLEYDWGGYDKILLFSSIQDFATIENYYEEELKLKNLNPGQGTLEYLLEENPKQVSLYIFNCKDESEYEDFEAWLASDNLSELKKEKPLIIGGLFYHED